MRYPELKDIKDPLIRLPLDLVRRIRPVMVGASAELRAAKYPRTGQVWSILDATALKTFKILLHSKNMEDCGDFECLRQAIQTDVDTALESVHYVHKAVGFGSIPLMWHSQLQEKLLQSECAEQIESKWLENHAEGTALREFGPVPRHQRTPDTRTARRIEEFRQNIESAGRRVRVKDMVAFCGYSDPTMFQRVQREAGIGMTKEARDAVERMLACPSAEEFWRIVEANSKKTRRR